MTEPEWHASTDPHPMLHFLRASGQGSDRKFRLYAAACCRRLWRWLEDERSRAAVALVEQLADRPAGVPDARRRKIRDEAQVAWSQVARPLRMAARAAYGITHGDALFAAQEVWYAAEVGTSQTEGDAAHADLLRDLFGPLPYRSVPLDPAWVAWNNGAVRQLAQAAYDEREMPGGTFDGAKVAVLADALEESGCSDEEIVKHLRGPGGHVRGCYVVDLLLNKS